MSLPLGFPSDTLTDKELKQVNDLLRVMGSDLLRAIRVKQNEENGLNSVVLITSLARAIGYVIDNISSSWTDKTLDPIQIHMNLSNQFSRELLKATMQFTQLDAAERQMQEEMK